MLEVVERAGRGWNIIMKSGFGGSNTIGVNDRFEKNTERLHGGVSITFLKS